MGKRDLGTVVEWAQEEGWDTKYTGGGHIKFTHPVGGMIFGPSTPSSPRAHKNLKAALIRATREVEQVPTLHADRPAVVPEGQKWCTRCKEIKPREAFSNNRNAKDGLQYNCRACQSVYDQHRGELPARPYRQHKPEVAEGQKWCVGCERAKPLDAFARNSSTRDGRQVRCRQCIAEYNSQRTGSTPRSNGNGNGHTKGLVVHSKDLSAYEAQLRALPPGELLTIEPEEGSTAGHEAHYVQTAARHAGIAVTTEIHRGVVYARLKDAPKPQAETPAEHTDDIARRLAQARELGAELHAEHEAGVYLNGHALEVVAPPAQPAWSLSGFIPEAEAAEGGTETTPATEKLEPVVAPPSHQLMQPMRPRLAEAGEAPELSLGVIGRALDAYIELVEELADAFYKHRDATEQRFRVMESRFEALEATVKKQADPIWALRAALRSQ